MKWILFSAILILTLCTQYVPIPSHKHGLTIGNKNSNLHIQAFYDSLCSDSKEVDEILDSVVNTIGVSKFKLSYIFVPLPYHLYSFKVHQMLFKINAVYQHILENQGEQVALQYINFILKNQDDFMQAKWRNYKITDFEFALAKLVANHLNLNMGQLVNALKPGNPSDIKTRAEWKYATGSLSVSGTPIFFANGVKIDGAENWNEEQWIKFIIEHS